MPAVTIRDVAKLAEVGVGTVSRVINDNPNVSELTRQRVRSAIEELDYSPHSIARRLSLGKTNNVAVIAPFFTIPSVVERLRGIESALAMSHYDLLLFNVEDPKRRDRHFRSVPRRQRVDGMLIISLKVDQPDIERFSENGISVVLVNARHPQLSYLAVDDVSGAALATQHLIDLGHRRIAFVSDYLDNSFGFVANRDRYQGYLQALSEAGIALRPEYKKQGAHASSSAQRLTYELLQLDEPPTAIFATSDTLAIGALRAAQELGISVPQKLSIIGYDDIDLAQHLNLTTVRQPLFESGVKGAKLLLKQLGSNQSRLRQSELPLTLMVRGTTAPLAP